MRHCVVIPFLGRFAMLTDCLRLVASGRQADTEILLINDGSHDDPMADEALAEWLRLPYITVLEHSINRGVAASRNTAIDWCRRQSIELIIMLDSDCLPDPDFVSTHLDLHRSDPAAACYGAAIEGIGHGPWAQLDRVISWVHAMPYGATRQVEHPYHLPTTNFSIKVAALPPGELVFDERLRTGEDALLIRTLRAAGKKVMFSPQPRIQHRDRERLGDVVRHHYEWGHHQYFVQLGKDFSRPVFKLWYRGLFTIAFALAMPIYAAMGSCLNIAPWLPHRPRYLGWLPAIYLVWLAKSFALLTTAIAPHRYLRETRVTLANTYSEREAA